MSVTQTYKHIPALRFPEFVNDGEWEMKRLGDICVVNPPSINIPEEFFYLDLESVVAGRIIGCQRIKKEEAPSRAQRSVEKYDVLFQMVRPYQQNNLFFTLENNQYIASTGYAILRAKEGLSDSGFIYQLVHTGDFLSQVMQRCTGSNYPAISSSSLEEIVVLFPPLAEQKRIAECLSAMDDMMAECNNKLEQLKCHKKGLMQQLFTLISGGGNSLIPRLRFPEFNNAKEWEIKKLGDCFTERVERNAIELPLLSLTESDGIVLQEETNRKNNSNADKSKYLRVYIGDIAYNTMRMWQGRCALVAIEGIVSPAYTICKPNVDMNPYFFYYLFKTSQMIEAFHGNSQGLVNDTLNLKYDSFAKINAHVPLLDEQNYIADCLFSADEIINLYSEKIALLFQYKKGLLQQMFPNSTMN